MYYQHYVIFEALHVICKQLKIIYYPKLYRSTNVWILISFIKNGVFWYICTHLHFHYLTHFALWLLVLVSSPWKKKGGLCKIRGHSWPFPGQTQPTGLLYRVWVLSLTVFGSLYRKHCSRVPTGSHFPTPSPLHSFIPPDEILKSWDLHLSVQNDTKDSIKLKDLPLILAINSCMCCNDITQSRLIQNKISQIQSLNPSTWQSFWIFDFIISCAFRSLLYYT